MGRQLADLAVGALVVFAAVAGDKGAGHIGPGQAAGLPQLRQRLLGAAGAQTASLEAAGHQLLPVFKNGALGSGAADVDT